jgi:mannose/fructose/N-acetylgalactosamine-specific phosphotransferase system component IIB
MPVVHLRVDNRLIHGQIMIAWSRKIKLDHIIVTNDKVAADPMQQTLLKAVAPQGRKVSVLSVKDCADYCRSPAAEKESIFVIAKTPEDVLGLMEAGMDIKEFNLGNAAYEPNTRKVSKTVYLTEPAAMAIKKLHDMGLRITSRMIPSEPDVEYWPTIEKAISDWLGS